MATAASLKVRLERLESAQQARRHIVRQITDGADDRRRFSIEWLPTERSPNMNRAMCALLCIAFGSLFGTCVLTEAQGLSDGETFTRARLRRSNGDVMTRVRLRQIRIMREHYRTRAQPLLASEL